MNNIYVPTQVVTLLKRLANVVSTFSISSHYFLSKPDCSTPTVPRERCRDLERTQLQTLQDWKWPPLSSFRFKEAGVSAKELTLQWLNTRWSRRSISLSVEMELPNSLPPPLRGGSEQNNKKQMENHHRKKEQAPDTVHKLLRNPALYDPLRTPRYPIVLCHGLYGFDTRGPSSFPSIRTHYWANVLNTLRGKLGAEVIVTSVPGTGSVYSRSESLDRQLQIRARGRGVNLLAHSMGGLDCRHLISRIKPTDYVPLSLTTISTPHRGSPFMDWCAERIGLGKALEKEGAPESAAATNSQNSNTPPSLSLSSLPSSVTTLILSVLDSPAYANLTTSFLNDVFNTATPDDPSVKYFSVAGRMSSASVWHPFWLPKMVLDEFEDKERSRLRAAWEKDRGGTTNWDPDAPPLWAQEREWGNDGLVTIQSAKWGEFLGIMEECDHWQIRGARGIDFGVDIPAWGADWSFRDWSRFPNIWGNKETKKHVDVKTTRSGALASTRSIATEAEHPVATPTPSSMANERAKEREANLLVRDDLVVKSSTDKLSAVVDWVAERVPSTLGLSSDGSGSVNVLDLDRAIKKSKEIEQKPKPKGSELGTKEDLERFYVALCRRIYDEGL